MPPRTLPSSRGAGPAPNGRTPGARRAPSPDTELAGIEGIFRALADRTRLRILALLGGGETCVCHLHESLRLPQPKVSRHLAYLRRAGLVATRRDGQWIYYRLAEPADVRLASFVASLRRSLGRMAWFARDRARLRTVIGTCGHCTTGAGAPQAPGITQT